MNQLNNQKNNLHNVKGKKISGIYLAVDYTPTADFIIDKIAKELGIVPDNGSGEDKEYKYHTTIIYSKFKTPLWQDDNPKSLFNFQTKNGSTIFKKSKPKISVPVKITGFGFFENTKDGRNFHIKVSSPFLTHEFDRAIKFGLPTDFPKYTPHITVKNNVPKDFTVPKEILTKYIGTILYTNDEYIEELDKK
mgnify:CR=1 FL=1